MSSRNTVSIAAVLGASGSGKSSILKLELAAAQPARRLVWDPKREYGAFGQATTKLDELTRLALSPGERGSFALTFQPALSRKQMRAQFNVFCLVAERARNAYVLVDELADVTEPGWAPEGWERLTRQGRHAGLTIRGASQRPAEIDKSFLGNASRIICFRMNAESDVTLLAKILGKDPRDVRELAPLEYFDRDMLSGQVSDKKKLAISDLERLPA